VIDDKKLFEKVFLVGILTRDKGESLDDVTATLADTGMFTMQEGRKVLDTLRADGLVDGSGLTMLGVEVAKHAREEFVAAQVQLSQQQKRIL